MEVGDFTKIEDVEFYLNGELIEDGTYMINDICKEYLNTAEEVPALELDTGVSQAAPNTFYPILSTIYFLS